MNLENELKKYDIEIISDALDYLGIKNHLSKFNYTVSNKMIIGPAYTVMFQKDDVKENCVAADYIDDVLPGSIVAIDNNGIDYCTVWGNILSLVAKQRKVKATLINGAARDFIKIKNMKYPVYSKYINCKTGKGVVKLKNTKCKITIDNVSIDQGDYIVLQNSMALVIPKDKLSDVLIVVKKIHKVEENIIKSIKKGNMTLKEARRRYKYNEYK